ncbi:MAG: formate dehydrogenase accessory sulfurtransferase FdhD, partial [Bryobacteraceae bacterium]
MKSLIVTVAIQRATGASGENRVADQDYVAVEEPLQIRLGKRDLAITMRTPGHDRELAAGFLFTEGILQSPAQISSIDADERGSITVCAKAGIDAGAESR